MAILQNEIIDHLLTLIERGRHGDMLPSQNELRRQFSVSTVTIRKALEKLEDRGMIFRHQGKGSFIRRPADETTESRTFLLILIPRKFTLADEFISALVNTTGKSSCHTIFYHYDDNEEVMFHELHRIAPHAVIWLAPVMFKHEKTLLKLLAMPLHVILFNRDHKDHSVSCVSGDFSGDGFMLGSQLLRQNVRKVLFLSLDMRMMFSRGRCEGLKKAVCSAGGDVTVIDAAEIIGTENTDDLEKSYAVLSAAAGKKLAENDFDAVVCAQGEIWNSMRKAVSLSGQNPDRFWFATFNKLEEEQIFSPKTVILDQPIARMAEAAVDLISRLQAGAPPEHLYFSSDLVLPSDR